METRTFYSLTERKLTAECLQIYPEWSKWTCRNPILKSKAFDNKDRVKLREWYNVRLWYVCAPHVASSTPSLLNIYNFANSTNSNKFFYIRHSRKHILWENVKKKIDFFKPDYQNTPLNRCKATRIIGKVISWRTDCLRKLKCLFENWK